MTRQDAYTEMQNGNKVAHQNFGTGEYYYMTKDKPGKIIAEDGVDHTETFWSTREGDFRKQGWYVILDGGIEKEVKAKTKAIELVKKIKPSVYCYLGSGMLTNEYNAEVALVHAKALATLVVEEVLGTDMLIDEEVYLETVSYSNFWRDVRSEIAKLTTEDVK